MNRIVLFLVLCCVSLSVKSQNIFPKALSGCNTEVFCLDCGDIKATADAGKLDSFFKHIRAHNYLNNLKGKVLFQVLVDSAGKGCVLSHTDVQNRILTQNIVMALNDFTGWVPAKTKDKIEGRTSINFVVEIANGQLTGGIQRIHDAFAKAMFDRPVNPKVSDKGYKYKNEHLDNYKFTVWNSENSEMTDNLSDYSMVDKNGMVWYQTHRALFRFDGSRFFQIDGSNSPFKEDTWFRSMVTDNHNVKWFYNEKGVYSYDDKSWIKYDDEKTGLRNIGRVDNIINNSNTGEVFFCTGNGLVSYKDGIWSTINRKTLKELPAERVHFAKRDSRNRLWIGTYSGSIMIDTAGRVTAFDSENTFLKGKCILDMAEDGKGNLYFRLYEYNDAERERNTNRGIGVLKTDGSMTQLTSANSGMVNEAGTGLFYDKFEDVLWISTFTAGLLRYDLADGWELYHNQNSALPTSAVTCISQDDKGIIYLSTRYGMVKMEKK